MRLLTLTCLAFCLLALSPARAFATANEADPVIAAVPANGLQFFYRLRAEYKAEHNGKLPSGTLYCDLRVDEKGDHLMRTINTMPSKDFVVFVQKRFNDLKFLPARDAQNRPMISTVTFAINLDGNPEYLEEHMQGVHYRLQPDMNGFQAETNAYYKAFLAAESSSLPEGSIPSTSKEDAPDEAPTAKNFEKVRNALKLPDGLSKDERESLVKNLRYRILVAPNGDFAAAESLHKEVSGAAALWAEAATFSFKDLKFTPGKEKGRNVYAWLVLSYTFE